MYYVLLYFAGLEVDEEPAEVEVKPILRDQVNISVVVEPPSSEESSQAPRIDQGDVVRVVVEDGSSRAGGYAPNDSSTLASLSERVVEGAEENLQEANNAERGILSCLFVC